MAAGLPDTVAWTYEEEKLRYVRPQVYIPDFILHLSSGKRIYVEAKGYFEPKDRTKMLLVRAQHPRIDIRFVFQNANNTLSPRSCTTYGLWATQHGFVWAEGKVPTSWLR